MAESKEMIFEKVKKLISERLSVAEEKVTMEASFIEDLGADSLDTVELLTQLEEEFSITIPDDDAENISTVASVVDYIEGLQK